MKKMLLLAWLFLLCPATAMPLEDADAIVRKADLLRAPKESYEFDAAITHISGPIKKEGSFKVYVKDPDHTLIELSTPADKGKSVLMVGDKVWIYLPKIRKPITLALKQRVMGEVSIGDITRNSFSHDYNAALVGEEKLKGIDAWVLDLQPKFPDQAYQKIRYWVGKNDFRPIQAEYFTLSGDPLKKVEWLEFSEMGGMLRPSLLFFQSSISKRKKTYFRLSNMAVKQFPDKMFTKEYMKSLGGGRGIFQQPLPRTRFPLGLP